MTPELFNLLIADKGAYEKRKVERDQVEKREDTRWRTRMTWCCWRRSRRESDDGKVGKIHKGCR